ncbi:DUF1990 family protein [Saccharopolyspora dendranthemae]|uniref:Uncharacterized protein (UPF0548 family) n=1 Tax=Saccharopolyspora dendranthemae TaxID=1181886 RepID=A0A561U7T5_9PSEU|nr:DUF1990 family protein [Saccharopolyspora dendranthemae]TWF95431.1 uncharacterized protein (UPF0548 family) [Saccharopolyspora dendranthemae]
MTGSRGDLLAGVDHLAALEDLGRRQVNYSAAEVREPAWNFDAHRRSLGSEEPGPPEPGGVWETACRLVRDYEFAVPRRIRAIYRRDSPLLGRDMLLEGAFYGLRFHMGVRVTEVLDESSPERVWGWSYETLEGHIERGKMSYLVIKHPTSGRVEFLVSGYSQHSPGLAPLTRLGWAAFGRSTQLRFYRHCAARMDRLVTESLEGRAPGPAREADSVVLAPSGMVAHRFGGVHLRLDHPG